MHLEIGCIKEYTVKCFRRVGRRGIAKPPKKADLCPCHAKCTRDIQRSI